MVSSLDSGGAERVASTLCNAWTFRGDTVTLLSTFSGGGEPFYSLDKSVESRSLAALVCPIAGRRKRYFARLRALRRLVSERKPDVVVSFLPNVNIAALAATAFSGVPCIICERSDPSSHPLGTLWRFACRFSYRFADLVAVQTDAVATSIKQLYGGLRRVAVVPNPLPQELMQMSANLGALRERRTLLSLGRLTKGKQVGQIVDVFATLAGEFPNWDLHIYGEGPEREELQVCIVKHDLQNRVVLRGQTIEPWQVMARADAFVINSQFEGFPNALLEAMGVGLPCVSSDCPSGPREISANGKYALLFAPGDTQGLRAALAQLMGNQAAREALGTQARDAVIARYSLSTVLRVWDGLFSSVRKIP